MSDLEIRPFTPDDTEAVRTSREILDEVAAVDSPWDHPWLPDRYEMMLRRGWDGEPSRPFLAMVGDRAVGTKKPGCK